MASFSAETGPVELSWMNNRQEIHLRDAQGDIAYEPTITTVKMCVSCALPKMLCLEIDQRRYPRLNPTLLKYHMYKVLDWTTWNTADNSIRSLGSEKLQGERYHLYSIHKFHFDSLVTSLASRCNNGTGASVSINANCYWIDGRPQAHWADGSGAKQNVELSDLLLDVTVSGAALIPTRRAMLIQGKWTESCTDLGSSSCNPCQNDSTNLERNLLETHCGPINLYASQKTVTPIPAPAPGNEFNVSKDAKDRMLIHHARYLLFPKTQDLTSKPYQVFVPTNRNTSTCAPSQYEDYEDLLDKLALPRPDLSIPAMQLGHEWTKLVDGVAMWAKQKHHSKKTVNRLKMNFPYHSNALGFVTTYERLFPYLNAFSSLGAGTIFGHQHWGASQGNLPKFKEFHSNGFWYIQLHVVYLDPIGD